MKATSRSCASSTTTAVKQGGLGGRWTTGQPRLFGPSAPTPALAELSPQGIENPGRSGRGLPRERVPRDTACHQVVIAGAGSIGRHHSPATLAVEVQIKPEGGCAATSMARLQHCVGLNRQHPNLHGAMVLEEVHHQPSR